MGVLLLLGSRSKVGADLSLSCNRLDDEMRFSLDRHSFWSRFCTAATAGERTIDVQFSDSPMLSPVIMHRGLFGTSHSWLRPSFTTLSFVSSWAFQPAWYRTMGLPTTSGSRRVHVTGTR